MSKSEFILGQTGAVVMYFSTHVVYMIDLSLYQRPFELRVDCNNLLLYFVLPSFFRGQKHIEEAANNKIFFLPFCGKLTWITGFILFFRVWQVWSGRGAQHRGAGGKKTRKKTPVLEASSLLKYVDGGLSLSRVQSWCTEVFLACLRFLKNAKN